VLEVGEGKMSMKHWWNDTNTGKSKHSEKYLSQRHFFHNNPFEWPEIYPGPPRWEAAGTS